MGMFDLKESGLCLGGRDECLGTDGGRKVALRSMSPFCGRRYPSFKPKMAAPGSHHNSPSSGAEFTLARAAQSPESGSHRQ